MMTTKHDPGRYRIGRERSSYAYKPPSCFLQESRIHGYRRFPGESKVEAPVALCPFTDNRHSMYSPTIQLPVVPTSECELLAIACKCVVSIHSNKIRLFSRRKRTSSAIGHAQFDLLIVLVSCYYITKIRQQKRSNSHLL